MLLAFATTWVSDFLLLRRVRQEHSELWRDLGKPSMHGSTKKFKRFVHSFQPLRLQDRSVSIYWFGEILSLFTLLGALFAWALSLSR